jgi:tetratricopeptide (TPR) repeat protein
LRQGERALEQDDLDAAEHFVLLLEAGGQNDHAHLLRGSILVKQRQYLAALKELNQVRDQGELLVEASALQGRCLLELGEPNQAERAFLFVLKKQPAHVYAHRGLAALYYDQGALSRAVQHCEEVAKLAPNDGLPHRFMGLIYQQLDQKEQAVESYRAALNRELPGDLREEVLVELASVLVDRSEYDQALDTLGELDALDSSLGSTPRVLTLQARCLVESKNDLAEAVALLKQAMAVEPPYPEAYRLRARLHVEAKEYPAAAHLLERIVQVDPADLFSRTQLARVYGIMGRAKDAEEQLQRGKEIIRCKDELTKLTTQVTEQPRNAQLHLRMAELYDQLNKKQLAERCRRNALALGATPRTGPRLAPEMAARIVGLHGAPLGTGPHLAAAALLAGQGARPSP